MIDTCANPECSKPLHYLREGQIFAFNLPDPSAPAGSTGYSALHVKHFWLCGDCSGSMLLSLSGKNDVLLLPRPAKQPSHRVLPMAPTAMAS